MLGSVLVPRLLQAGYQVETAARSGGVTFKEDLTTPGAASRMIAMAEPDAVIHLAAATDVDRCEREPHWAYLQNVQAAQLLAMACAQAAKPVHLVHISTDHVYDGDGCHAEADVTIRNHYAISKLAGELAVLTHPATTVLRVNFIGRSLRPGRNSFSDWVVASLRSGSEIQVFGDVSFSPLRMETLARTISHVMAYPCHGIFNAGARGAMSKAAVAHFLAQGLRLDASGMRTVNLADRQLPAPRPTGMAMNSTRFEQAFSLPLPGIEAEMQALVEEYSSEV